MEAYATSRSISRGLPLSVVASCGVVGRRPCNKHVRLVGNNNLDAVQAAPEGDDQADARHPRTPPCHPRASDCAGGRSEYDKSS